MIKPQHIINHCNKIFKSKLEVQIMLQNLYDMLQLVNNEQLLDLEPNSYWLNSVVKHSAHIKLEMSAQK